MPFEQKRGISLPFRVTPGDADVATSSGPELRKTHLEVILGTRASAGQGVGELDWDPGRGSRFELLRNAAASEAVEDFAVVYADEALQQSLPDEVLLSVAVVVDDRNVEITAETRLRADASVAPRKVTSSTTVRR